MDIEGPALESLIRSARKQIRGRMQALRLAVPAAARARRDAALVARLLVLPEVAGARTIALFSPMEGRGEIELRALDAHVREGARGVLYPRLSERALEPGEAVPSLSGELALGALTDLVESDAGFLEPPRTVQAAVRGEVDVIVVPALAVSATGHRLGYGAGFYDRVLPAYCPPAFAIAVAYDFQLVAELPVFEWDFACNAVVTDTRTLRVTG
ncbi:MAG TPA: 5-formyltetrahydrofolate cyclo-ligase [Polyangiaceae bacterium]|nr:5-formyltetrahydrofolate cyclo-ligase [Polyangiaceae bacterium]